MSQVKEEERRYELKPYEPNVPSINRIKYEDFEFEEQDHLRDYLNIVLRRKWAVILFFLSVVVTVTLSSFIATPVYKSTVVIKVDRENPDVLAIKDMRVDTADQDYYETQYKILKSRNLAKRVVDKLDLYKPPAEDTGGGFFSLTGSAIGAATSAVKGLFATYFTEGAAKDEKTDPPASPDPAFNQYLHSFMNKVKVVPVRNSQLVEISFLSRDPLVAQKVANSYADSYIDFNIQSSVDASKQAGRYLERQIDTLKSKIEASEEALNNYSSKNEMLFLDDKDGKSNLYTQEMSEISTALNAAITQRMQAEALHNQIVESGPDNPAILNNPLIQGLKSQYDNLEAQYFNLLKIFKPDYPKMKQIKSQMDSVQSRINQEKANLSKAVASDYYAALKREQFLRAEFEKDKEKVLDFQRKGVQYSILKREVDTDTELYNSLLQRLKEVNASSTRATTNVQVIDAAELPKEPFRPDKPLNVLLSVIFGLAGGIGLAFFIEYFDNTVKNTHEVEKKLRMPTLGMIPFQKWEDQVKRPMLAHSRNRGPVAEAFRSIGTFILLSSSSKPPKSILVTSPGEKEGKTTVCINTAMALTESLGRGIIVDADLRRPRLHHTFEADNSVGLSTFLSGNIEFDSTLIKQTAINGLSILTSGPVPPNPSELLISKRMKDLVDALYGMYDFIIIDSVPIMGLPDSIYLSSIVDGTVLVIKAGQTLKNSLAEAKKIFRNINSKVLGVVLNGIKETDLKYGHYSHYYSSYFKETRDGPA